MAFQRHARFVITSTRPSVIRRDKSHRPLFTRKRGMNILAVLSGATKLCRNMDSHAELGCLSITPGRAKPPVCTTAQRPVIKRTSNSCFYSKQTRFCVKRDRRGEDGTRVEILATLDPFAARFFLQHDSWEMEPLFFGLL